MHRSHGREESTTAEHMSDALKEEFARELGVAEIVRREGWGGVSAKKCGELVKLAIQRAEESLR